MIGILDYGMGNLRSVSNAIEHIGYDAVLISEPRSFRSSISHLILPGVGSYARAMQNLKESGLQAVIREHVRAGRPFLGICLGMQLLSSKGYEHGETPGLGIIEGETVPLNIGDGYLIPHMGWNTVALSNSHPVFERVKNYIDFYFVHTFFFKPAYDKDVLSLTCYESDFASAVARKNVVGVQFHPEKSQDSGLKILENFCGWDGHC